MNTTAKVVLFSLFFMVMFNTRANENQHGEMMNMQPVAQQEQLISATGVIEAVDMESKKVTIKHDLISAVNWPAMTMRFTLVADTKTDDIKPGDKATFTLVQQGNLSVLRDIYISKRCFRWSLLFLPGLLRTRARLSRNENHYGTFKY